ncbi:type VI secretion system tube protein Hcp [Rahnella sp. AA]|uniref:Hcp family type VI secretion system effector n=1 Tax=Rahnella sp. AA TaxID=2057180 RepID=UPI000C321DEE|nr:Hcp family type VI secretion system effector [Rahnella sp. AA]PKE29214.1 type VI secretion system tube protein Hcp [Rahnella sp. AA]
MAIPSYLWLKDDGGNNIKGSVDVSGREGSIEIIEFAHSLSSPIDGNTGKITGLRKHSPMIVVKEFDMSSPYLYKAVSSGQTLKSAEVKWYQINDAGQEVEYFNMFLENVRIASVSPLMHNIKNSATEKFNHMESLQLTYEKVTWTFKDGNISHSDSWIENR